MRSARPVVRALVMTTAVAWSIGAGVREAEAERQATSSEWAGTSDRVRGLAGPTVLPFSRDARTGAAAGSSNGPGRS